ncbi:restriction endonuclease subunit S [Paenibacillus sepulcri]|uniref:Restriction endonuclease subunit S n=1 Tax=Paenibacillus sepulcri TaxID=359917 RepID=A0ABS7CC25_9BACL|nr:restriction endonuclease subunit S [Paenibacillus sepulcri]
MSRETAYARMLDASAKMQWNVAMILEAKAVEAEKVRSWLCNHVTPDAFTEQEEQLKETLLVHEQLIEVIDGLTKLNQGMANVLKAALRHDQDSGGGFGGAFGGGFDIGDRD